MRKFMFLSLMLLGMMSMSFISTESSFDSQNCIVTYSESDPAKSYLPSFPIVVYENILFGKDNIETFEVLFGDKCSSDSGNCKASCGGACLCSCGPSGCGCAPINFTPHLGNSSVAIAENIKVMISRQSLQVLTKSAVFFKNYKTSETNEIYLYMYRVAVALNANDEQSYASLVFRCNELIQQLPDEVRSDYNVYALENGLEMQI